MSLATSMVVITRRKKQRLVNQKRLKNQPSLLHENLGLMDEVNRSRNSFKRKPSLGNKVYILGHI